MKVFGLGFGKTGTSTLGTCLREIGYSVYGADPKLTKKYRCGELNEIYKVSDEYDAFVDFPWPFLYEEMDNRYDNVKFILTTRSSSEKWIESLKKHTDRNGPSEHKKLAYNYRIPYEYEEEIQIQYENHNKKVRSYFKNRSKDFAEVCWEEGDGWKKVCKFLGENVPSKEFPHRRKSPKKSKIYRSWKRATYITLERIRNIIYLK